MQTIECATCDETCAADVLAAMHWRDFTPHAQGPPWSHLWMCRYCAARWVWPVQGLAAIRHLAVPTPKDRAGIEP